MATVAVFAVSPVPLRAVFGVDFHNRGELRCDDRLGAGSPIALNVVHTLGTKVACPGRGNRARRSSVARTNRLA